MTRSSMAETGSALLEGLARSLTAAQYEVKANRNRVEVFTGGPPTVVSLFDRSGDGEVPAITVTTMLPDEVGTLGDDALMAANQLAALSAIVPLGEGKYAAMNRFSLVDGIDLDIYGRLLVGAAMFQWESIYRVITYLSADEPTTFQPLPGAEDPSSWDGEDFESCRAAFAEAEMFTTAGRDGVTAEVPMAEGAQSAALGHVTSLIRLTATTHPCFGNGMMFLLRMPWRFERDDLMQACGHLNELELSPADVPPFVGGWCPDQEEGGLAFCGFVPNLLYLPSLAPTIGAWLAHKSLWAASVFADDDGE